MNPYFLLLVMLCTAGPLKAVEFFVETSGDDEHPGTRMQPFRSISKAASVMNPGDSCTISRGLYRETIRPARSGKAGAPLVFRSAANESVSLTGAEESPDGRPERPMRDWGLDAGGLSHIELRSVNLVSCGINLAGARMCHIEDCHLWWGGNRAALTNPVAGATHSVPFAAAILVGGKDNEIVHCSIIGNAGYGLALLDGSVNNYVVNCLFRGKNDPTGEAGILAQGTAPVIRNVSVMNYAGGAILCSNVQNARIEYNDLHQVGAGGTNVALLCLAGDGKGTVLAGNWIHDNGSLGGVGVRLDGPVENYVLRQNVIWGNPGTAIVMRAPSRYNFIFNNTCALNGAGIEALSGGATDEFRETRVINNIFAGAVWTAGGGVPPARLVWKNNYSGSHPGFVDETNRNFRLAAGSPCIDAGQAEPEFTDEFTGTLPDMGAWEFGKEYPVPGCHVNERANTVVAPVVKIMLETETPDAELRYTLDGRIPDQTSPVYTGALSVVYGAMVKAKAFRPGMEESGTTTAQLRQME